jgi:hypothetical protein
MSNPSVILLAEKEISGQSFRIEDNIGEAIHIHLGAMRIDMSVDEFLDFAEQTETLINRLVAVEGFDVRDFDPIYLFLGLKDFIGLERIATDRVALERLVTDITDSDGDERLVSLSSSRVIEALKGDETNLLAREQTNLYGETNQGRFERILKSVKEKGYPLGNNQIILYNDGFYIRDGLHRASCLLYLHGNIEVPALRLYFRDNAHSDEQRQAESKEVRIHRYERVDSEQIIKPLYKALLNALLAGKRVAIKGAGKHTEEVLAMLDGDIEVKCLIAKERRLSLPLDIEIISEAELKDYDVDIILLSSLKQREEMANDILKAALADDKDYFVLDIYRVLENLGVWVSKGIF